MSITKHELRGILNEAGSYKELRSRIEKIASVEDKEKQRFVEMITRLNASLAEVAGVEPLETDPNVTEYHCLKGLGYTVGDYRIRVNAYLEYQDVSALQVVQRRTGEEIAEIKVYPLGPEEAVALAEACVNHLSRK